MAELITIIDDDPDLREVVSLLVSSKGYEVETFVSALAFLAAPIKSACIITDVRMPDLSGMELLTRMRERKDWRPVILLTAHGDVAMATKALKLGAIDFIEKPFANEQLLEAVRQAITLHADRAAEQVELASIRERFESLTVRQRETMHLLVQGMATKEIANHLDISPRTVEAYRAWVMTKMNAKSIAELVRMALRLEGKKVA
jgi:two-component system response regulator FixJ